ncbi:MAG: hypothetical protein WD844_11330 [Thermoleophilaceae bacterium]
MTRNGQQRPARPRLEIAHSSATPGEAAAIAAAIEQFLHDTAPAPAAPAARINPWLRAALYENAGLDPSNSNAWGDGEPWGR